MLPPYVLGTIGVLPPYLLGTIGELSAYCVFGEPPPYFGGKVLSICSQGRALCCPNPNTEDFPCPFLNPAQKPPAVPKKTNNPSPTTNPTISFVFVAVVVTFSESPPVTAVELGLVVPLEVPVAVPLAVVVTVVVAVAVLAFAVADAKIPILAASWNPRF